MKHNGLEVWFTNGGKDAAGYAAEKSDCVIRAFSRAAILLLGVAPEVSYRNAYAQVQVWTGRRKNCATFHLAEKAQSIGAALGLELTLVYAHWSHARVDAARNGRLKTTTLEQFVRQFPRGTFYVRITGHALLLHDGVIHDAFAAKPRMRVLNAWHVAPAHGCGNPS